MFNFIWLLIQIIVLIFVSAEVFINLFGLLNLKKAENSAERFQKEFTFYGVGTLLLLGIVALIAGLLQFFNIYNFD